MRSMKVNDNIIIHYNSDLSGDIEVVNIKTGNTSIFTYNELRNYFYYPSKDPKKLEWVKTLFASIVRSKIISAVEQMSDEEVFKLELFLDK